MTEEVEMGEKVDIAIIGAGLVGSLLSLALAKRGFSVDVFERRADMRREEISAGRSINLNISCRGLEGLRQVGALDEVLAELVPMRGRMMHSREGTITYQAYGKDDTEYGNSVSRGGLNKILMDLAEATGRVRFHFGMKAASIDFDGNSIVFEDRQGGSSRVEAELIFGSDGSASCLRRAMHVVDGFKESIEPLDYGYKELYISPSVGGGFQIEKNALHIWPRGTYMMIALPNCDGSFTVTLFLSFEGEESFQKLNKKEDVEDFFSTQFPDSISLMPDLVETFFENPTGHMETVKCFPWNYEGKTLLLGDAAHAVVPFFGQGMNCGFEDVTVFNKLLLDAGEDLDLPSRGSEHKKLWEKLFSSFGSIRKPDCDAIADMAVENFVEMRDKVADPKFLMEKQVEKRLANEFPGKYKSRYQLVTFTNVPYSLAREAGVVCDEILSRLCEGMSSVDEIDLSLARELIEERLDPILNQPLEPTST